MHGHDVTIFEAREKSGGLNEYGIAAYKTTNDFAQDEVEFILQIGGITIENGKALGSRFHARRACRRLRRRVPRPRPARRQ
jgi:NADPH-dependent glutamate synthase beta subunit-like oxidoreductase